MQSALNLHTTEEKEIFMALLQVRDFPAELYALLAFRAKMENRSLTQQTIYMLKNDLEGKNSKSESKRALALKSLSKMNLSLPKNSPTPAELIREDRDR